MNKNPSGFKKDIDCANIDWGYAALEESDTESEDEEILETTPPEEKIKKNVNAEFNKRVLTFKESLMVNIKHQCFYCKLDGKIARHIFLKKKNCNFMHDMHGRPVIIVFPIKHYKTIHETGEELHKILLEIREFCKEWKIGDYSVTYNMGRWKSHEHFHVKIKTKENVIKRLRNNHFKFIKKNKRYNNADYIKK
tara:strand:+ start:181 stop:762 length:582 start_codon:yes stop_codon:yes gene_type:complete